MTTVAKGSSWCPGVLQSSRETALKPNFGAWKQRSKSQAASVMTLYWQRKPVFLVSICKLCHVPCKKLAHSYWNIPAGNDAGFASLHSLEKEERLAAR